MGSSPIQVANFFFNWQQKIWRCSAKNASVAQSVEQGTENPRVDGSIPSGGTTFIEQLSGVFRRCAKAINNAEH